MLPANSSGGGLSWQEDNSRLRLSIELEERSPILDGGGSTAGRGPYPKSFRKAVPKVTAVQGVGHCVRIKFIAMRDTKTLKEDRFSGLCHATVSLWTSPQGGGAPTTSQLEAGGGGDDEERPAAQCDIWLRLGAAGALRSHAHALAICARRVLPCPPRCLHG